MKEISYLDIVKSNNTSDLKNFKIKYDIKILANITLSQIPQIFTFHLAKFNIYANTSFGEFDNIVIESEISKNEDLVIIFYDLKYIIDKYNKNTGLLNDDEISYLKDSIIDDLNSIINNTKNNKSVVINLLSTSTLDIDYFNKSNIKRIAIEVNSYLLSRTRNNLHLFDTDKLITEIGLNQAINYKHYFSSKNLYSFDFQFKYVEKTLPIILNNSGIVLKCLILDCDNTLWSGIIGEDGYTGIKMNNETYIGYQFSKIQKYINYLSETGILVCLCSKNNDKDVEEVISKHPDFQIKNIIIKKINWENKVDNIKQILLELNIGEESVIFVDDSNYEIELVKSNFKNIKTFLVPENIDLYFNKFTDYVRQFTKIMYSDDDINKYQQYSTQINRTKLLNSVTNMDDYLANLNLQLTVKVNDKQNIERIYTLTQKTNQFNLTTKRYTQSDIQLLINDKNKYIFTGSVIDKFGDNGITILAIVIIENDTAIIDTFLMSCRIIGRTVEFAFIDFIIKFINNLNIRNFISTYVKSEKNQQVANFYNNLGFEVIHIDSSQTKYKFNSQNISKLNINHKLQKINHE